MPYNIIDSVDQYQLPVTGFETIANLRKYPDADSPAWTRLGLVFVAGATVFRDGGNRFYMWDPTSAVADDGINTIKPTAITGAGRWVLISGGGSGAPGATLNAGSGSPEGVVTANVGSIYTDTLTATVYKKLTGSGNTGWA
jgi:hypothetical protein